MLITIIEVSVIVPVYNVEKTLERCLDSILSQQGNIEVICVEDCSTDCSPSILKKYADSNKKIRVIWHEKNMGLLITRHDGVMIAEGKYIMFVDSDDYLLPNACLELSALMREQDVDIIQFKSKVFGCDDVTKNYFLKYLEPHYGRIENNLFFRYLFDKPLSWNMWNHIYKKEICKKAYSEIKLINIVLNEDVYTMFYIAYFSNTYYGIDKEYYAYGFGTGISTTSISSYVEQMERICKTAVLTEQCISFLKKEGKYEQYCDLCFKTPISNFDGCLYLLTQISDVKIRNEMSRLICDSYSNYISDHYFFVNYIESSKNYEDNEKLIKENATLNDKLDLLENSTYKAIKNVFMSLIRKVRR